MTVPDQPLSDLEARVLELLAESPRKPVEPEDIGYLIGHNRSPRKALSSLRKRGLVRRGKLYGEFTTYLITDAGLRFITGDYSASVGRLLGARAEAFDGVDPSEAARPVFKSPAKSRPAAAIRPNSVLRHRRKRSKKELKGCGCLIVLATLLLLGLLVKCQTP